MTSSLGSRNSTKYQQHVHFQGYRIICLYCSMWQVNYPMDNGIVRNWEDMIHVYDHTFGKERLNVDTTNSRILLTEPPMNPMKNRERMVEVRDKEKQTDCREWERWSDLSGKEKERDVLLYNWEFRPGSSFFLFCPCFCGIICTM